MTCLKALSSVVGIPIKGKDVICKDGVSNKLVLWIYKQNVLLYMSPSFYCHEPNVYAF